MAGPPPGGPAISADRRRRCQSRNKTCWWPLFLAGGKEILNAEVSRDTIRDALSIIRRLWNAGIAHRVIKPSNLLVRDGRVFLIDVAFCQVRPSPGARWWIWRT